MSLRELGERKDGLSTQRATSIFPRSISPTVSMSTKIVERSSAIQTVPRHRGFRNLAHKLSSAHIRPWLIPVLYALGAILTGFTIPRSTSIFLPQFVSTMSVSAAIGIYSAIASGMMALTGIVFSLAFVMIQFSATAYSPRLVLWISRDPVMPDLLRWGFARPRHIYGDILLRPYSARLGRQRRLWPSPTQQLVDGGGVVVSEHGHVH